MTTNIVSKNIIKYPLKFQQTYVEKVWGGSVIAKEFNRDIDPEKKIGESWELSGLPGYESRVVNGPLAGQSIAQLINTYKCHITGKNALGAHKESFPLLVKIIDAHDNLSVQVHPDDHYASKNYGSYGKNEIWYVLSAKKGARIIAGFNGKKKPPQIVDAVMKGSLDRHLKYIPVKKDDIIYIPAGRVHALLEGVVVAEIQQASDLTFRLYDWDRTADDGMKRKLHIEESLEVLNYEDYSGEKIYRSRILDALRGYSEIISNDYFTIYEYRLKRSNALRKFTSTIENSFRIIMVIEGRGKVAGPSGSEDVCKGELVLIPAAMGQYTVSGKIRFLQISC